jgi:hypothetical protein
MQKKNRTFFGLIALLLAASLFLLHSSAPVQENPTCCKKSLNKCSDNKNSSAPGEMIMETMSRQFISLNFSVY